MAAKKKGHAFGKKSMKKTKGGFTGGVFVASGDIHASGPGDGMPRR